MIKILVFLFAFEVGYSPTNQLFLLDNYRDYEKYYAEFNIELVLYEMFFVRGELKNNFYQKGTLNFSPDSDYYTVGAGFRYKGFEAGFKHTCMHPVFVGLFNGAYYGRPKFEGGYESFYLKFSGKVNIF